MVTPHTVALKLRSPSLQTVDQWTQHLVAWIGLGTLTSIGLVLGVCVRRCVRMCVECACVCAHEVYIWQAVC